MDRDPLIGVDVGGTKLLAVRLAPDGSVAGTVSGESPRSTAQLLVALRSVALELCGQAPAAVGVGVPGLVDRDGVVRFAPNLPGIAGSRLGAEVRAAFPVASVWIGNDATAACWAEHRAGAALGHDEVVMVTLGTGIGGGIVSGGRLLEGTNRFAGEFGHMVVDPQGPRCPCGKRGCWERLASGSGLALLAQEAALAGKAPLLVELAGGDPGAVRGEHVTRAARQGDPNAVEIVERFAWWLALGLANLANALDPEMFVIGGGLVEAAELFLEPARRAFAELVEAPGARKVRIVEAALGPPAGAVGAALRASAGALEGG